MSRRRPVPSEWREEHHYFYTHSQRHYAAMHRDGYYSRSGGTCACGKKFGLDADKHTMNTADVYDAWMDHVEEAYYSLPKEER